MKRWIAPFMLGLLMMGCGAETVGTAAIQASLKAQEAEEAKRIQQDVQRQMEAAQQLQQQRLDETLRAADQASQ
ncbi:MAG: hypothetical protein H6935_10120 [Thiobacillus sp.]|nr:hypothetical protein [Thiobacillus sp.]